MKTNYTRIISVVICLIAVSSLGCRKKVPIKEMLEARKAIQRAKSVMAEKYAGEEFAKARNSLMESHGKLEDNDDKEAKEEALNSLNWAKIAYDKSVPLLADDTITVAENSIQQANEVYAEHLAEAEFSRAEDYLKKAENNFQNKEYYQAYQDALKADEEAKRARNIAIGKKDILKDSIVEVKLTLEDAEKYGARESAPENYKLAVENLTIAEESYGSLELKKGFSAIEIAKINADEAFITAIKKTAGDRMTVAEKAVSAAEKAPVNQSRKDEIAAARESLENAKSSYGDMKYRESIEASDEAIRLASMKEGIVIARETDEGLEGGKEAEEEGETAETAEEEGEKDYFLYTVKDRTRFHDCLWYIAKRFYNNPYLWPKIYKANNDKIRNPNRIYPGQVLKVPKLEK